MPENSPFTPPTSSNSSVNNPAPSVWDSAPQSQNAPPQNAESLNVPSAAEVQSEADKTWEETVAAAKNPVPVSASPLAARDAGAKWFFWIAGLSMLNTLFMLTKAKMTFGLGLASTLLVDAFARGFTKGAPNATQIIYSVDFVLDLLIAGTFVLFGVQAQKGKSWAFVVGGVLLALDTILVLLFKMWVGVAVHIFALLSIYAGYTANCKVNAPITTNAQGGNSWSSSPPQI